MSAFFLTYMVLFSTIPLPNGEETATQVTLIQKYEDVETCRKAVEATAKFLKLTPEQKDDLGCVRFLKGDAKLKEA